MPSSLIAGHRYIPGIDGLRALAVLAVIAYHLQSSWMPGGFSGVDVFFVISGYVVSASLARASQQNLRQFALHFYARRVVRIVPALVVCLAVVGFVSTLIIPASWLNYTSAITAVSAFFGLSNFALVIFNDGYFAPRVEFNAFTHTWSLAVEEQFYLVFPVVFYAWLKGRTKRGALRFVANGLWAFLLFASLFCSWVQTRATPDQAYYLLPGRFWELAAGAVLFKLLAGAKVASRSRMAASAWVLAGLTLVGLGFVLSDQNSFPFPWAIIPVCGTVSVITGVVSMPGKGTLASRILDNRLLVAMGKLSYSLYLWHWPVFVAFRWTTGLHTAGTRAAAMALVALMSVLSYRYVETPARKCRLVATRSDGRIIALGCASIALFCACSLAIFMAQPLVSLSTTSDRSVWYPLAWPSAHGRTSAPAGVMKGRTLFVVGDSHAGAYSTMLQMLKEEYGVEVRQISKGGGPVADLLGLPTRDRFGEVMAEIVKRAQPQDIVFLASLRLHKLCDQWGAFDADEVAARQQSSEAARERAAGLRYADEVITKLESRRLRVMIDAPKPMFRSPPFRCSDWFNAGNPVCKNGFAVQRDFLLEFRRPIMNSLEVLAQKHEGLIVWDPFPVLCPTDTCSAFDGDKPLFFDGDHLSAHGNRVLYPSFRDVITRAWTSAAR